MRTSEREGWREGWRREKELLAHYYPSVTGLLGSCHGYRDSRLSVLLTIAHKGGIQLWATIPTPPSAPSPPLFSASVSLICSFYICLPFTSVHIFCFQTYLSLCFLGFFFCFAFHSTSQTGTLQSPVQPLPPLAVRLSHHTHTSSTIREKGEREIMRKTQSMKCYFPNCAEQVQTASDTS